MSDPATTARPGVDLEFEQYRSELTGYCYRMLGSAFEAEDAVQDTLVRAWRGFDRFEGRSAVKSWLYSIATNVCLDMLKSRQRRALPMDLGPSSSGDGDAGPRLPEDKWLQPIPDGMALPPSQDPAELTAARETIQVAFVAALQHLPPKQRAVLILREVLRWKAEEVAELLETSVASVNSALQRARATMASTNVTESDALQPDDEEQRELLARYVDAFERFDIEKLVSLLHEDATMSMPPYDLWLQGRDALRRWLLGSGSGCRGSRFEPVEANGTPGFAQWRSAGPGAGYNAWAIHLVEMSDGQISGIHFFVDPNLFSLFDLPVHLDA